MFELGVYGSLTSSIDMYIKSLASNIKRQLELILSPKSYRLMTGLSLYKCVLTIIRLSRFLSLRLLY